MEDNKDKPVDTKTLTKNSAKTDSRLGTLLPPLDKRYNKSDIIDCIYMCCGVLTLICIMLDCTLKQFKYWLRKYPEAYEDLAAAKEFIVSKAEEVIIGAMGGDDKAMALDAAKHIMKVYGKQTPQQMVNVQINTGDKTSLIKAIFGILLPDATVDSDENEDGS